MMNEEKVMRAIEHFNTEMRETDFMFADDAWLLPVQERVFCEILRFEGAEHLKFLIPSRVGDNEYKEVIEVLWDITQEEGKTYTWNRFLLNGGHDMDNSVKGKDVAKSLRKVMKDIKVELEMIERQRQQWGPQWMHI